MLQIQLQSDAAPLGSVALQQGLMALFARSAAMGMLHDERVTAIDAGTLRKLLDALQRADLLRSARLDLAPLLRKGPATLDAPTAQRMAAQVGRLVDTLDESPSPTTEWPAMRETFGDEVLARLAGVSEASLRRYAAGSRATPQHIAERLHWLAMVVADLAGAYNSFGIRRWFDRPRSQLGGKSPVQRLGRNWGVDDPAARQVRALAAALSGAQPLAA